MVNISATLGEGWAGLTAVPLTVAGPKPRASAEKPAPLLPPLLRPLLGRFQHAAGAVALAGRGPQPCRIGIKSLPGGKREEGEEAAEMADDMAADEEADAEATAVADEIGDSQDDIDYDEEEQKRRVARMAEVLEVDEVRAELEREREAIRAELEKKRAEAAAAREAKVERARLVEAEKSERIEKARAAEEHFREQERLEQERLKQERIMAEERTAAEEEAATKAAKAVEEKIQAAEEEIAAVKDKVQEIAVESDPYEDDEAKSADAQEEAPAGEIYNTYKAETIARRLASLQKDVRRSTEMVEEMSIEVSDLEEEYAHATKMLRRAQDRKKDELIRIRSDEAAYAKAQLTDLQQELDILKRELVCKEELLQIYEKRNDMLRREEWSEGRGPIQSMPLADWDYRTEKEW